MNILFDHQQKVYFIKNAPVTYILFDFQLECYFAQVSFNPVILLNTNLPPAWSTRSVTK
jgi:hypothetical protein